MLNKKIEGETKLYWIEHVSDGRCSVVTLSEAKAIGMLDLFEAKYETCHDFCIFNNEQKLVPEWEDNNHA